MCPEKEVEFQRAPNGEPCLPTHPPTPCCLCPPASHANSFCHVRVLLSSSLHVCAVWAGVACPARRGPLPKVTQRPTKVGIGKCGVEALLCPQQPRAISEACRATGPVAHTGRNLTLGWRGPVHQGIGWQALCLAGLGFPQYESYDVAIASASSGSPKPSGGTAER